MIVTCPACSTRYRVDPHQLGSAGRMVRCATCANTWHQQPTDDLPRPLVVAPDEQALGESGSGESGSGEPAMGGRRSRAGRYPPPTVAPPRRGWPALVGAGLLAVLVIGIVAGIALRERVVTMWPSTGRLFGMVGLAVPPPGAGLQLDGVKLHRDIENGVPVLIVEGTVANTTSVGREVPKILVLLKDKDNNVVQSWTFAPPETRVPGAGSVPFSTTIVQPSSSATGIAVDFAEGG